MHRWKWDSITFVVVMVVTSAILVATEGFRLKPSSWMVLGFIFLAGGFDLIFNRVRDISDQLKRLHDLLETRLGK